MQRFCDDPPFHIAPHFHGNGQVERSPGIPRREEKRAARGWRDRSEAKREDGKAESASYKTDYGLQHVRKAFPPLLSRKLSTALLNQFRSNRTKEGASQVSSPHNAESMKVFHFGDLRHHPKGDTMGSHALHIQCPWRLTTPQKSVTGSEDYWYSSDPELEDKGWKPGAIQPSLQEKRILFEPYGVHLCLGRTASLSGRRRSNGSG
jgi:hypothetical protein